MGKKIKTEKKPLPTPPTELKAPGSYLREEGTLWLADKFDKENILPLVAAIQEYNIMPEDKAPKMITLMINSPGGMVDWLFPLVNAIRLSKIPVLTVADGMAASCGCMLLMAGDKRVAMATANIMSHQYSGGHSGKEHEIYASRKSDDMVSEKILQHYARCTGKSEKYIRKHLLGPSDVWLSPDEAKLRGVIDEVWEV